MGCKSETEFYVLKKLAHREWDFKDNIHSECPFKIHINQIKFVWKYISANRYHALMEENELIALDEREKCYKIHETEKYYNISGKP